MKFVTFKHEGIEQVGILALNEQGVYPIKSLGINYDSMISLIENITDHEMDLLQKSLTNNDKEYISLEDISKMPPIPNPNQDIICLGINYMEHAVESARYKNEAFGGIDHMQYIFLKELILRLLMVIISLVIHK